MVKIQPLWTLCYFLSTKKTLGSNQQIIIPLFLQPYVNIGYFKLWQFDLAEYLI